MAKRLKSVIVDDQEHCAMCGRPAQERHHIFNKSYKKKSEEDGYILPLCNYHHQDGKMGIHNNIEIWNYWRAICQAHFEETHTRDEFRERYGKSYL